MIDLLKLYSGTDSFFQNDLIFGGRRDAVETPGAKADVSASAKALNSHAKWNRWLTYCLNNNDLSTLIRVRRDLQVGMDDLVKKKMNTPEISQMFVRWVSSIDKTARKIIHKRNPMPKNADKSTMQKWKKQKAQIDLEFEKYLKKASY